MLSGIRLVHDVPYTGPRQVDLVGAALSVLGMGGIVLGILVWQEGGEAVGALLIIGAIAMAGLVWWLVRRKREGKPTLIDPDLFRSHPFRFGISQQMLQQIALGGTMIALPIYLQMVLEYNAMQAGLSMAPLSLSMFGVAVLAGKRGPPSGGRAASSGRASPCSRPGWWCCSRSCPGPTPAGAPRPPGDRRVGPGAAGVPAQQLHPGPDLGGAGQRGRRRELGRGVVRAVVRAGLRGGHHARDPVGQLHQHGPGQHPPTPDDQQRVAAYLEEDAQVLSNTGVEELLAGQPEAIQEEIIRINTDAWPLALQVALLVPILAGILGLFNSFRPPPLMRLPNPHPVGAHSWGEKDRSPAIRSRAGPQGGSVSMRWSPHRAARPGAPAGASLDSELLSTVPPYPCDSASTALSGVTFLTTMNSAEVPGWSISRTWSWNCLSTALC